MKEFKIPRWFWQLMIVVTLAGAAFSGYLMATDQDQDTGYVWYIFLFLMATWYALRQLRQD